MIRKAIRFLIVASAFLIIAAAFAFPANHRREQSTPPGTLGVTGAAHEKELDIARIFVFCVLIGAALLWLGVRRLKTARQQGVILILLAILLNAWWIVFMVMDVYKTAFLKRGT